MRGAIVRRPKSMAVGRSPVCSRPSSGSRRDSCGSEHELPDLFGDGYRV